MNDRLAAALSAHLQHLQRTFGVDGEGVATFDSREDAEAAAKRLAETVGGKWEIGIHWDLDHENGADSRVEAWTVVREPN